MPSTDKNRQANLNAASAQANKRLKENHTDEWNALMLEEATARGEQWAPRLTPEQRAEIEFESLLKAHPHLAEKLQG